MVESTKTNIDDVASKYKLEDYDVE